jgi:hypothetical protein
MYSVNPLSRRQQTILERRQLTHGVGVRLRAILHRRGHEIDLRRQLLLGGVDVHHVPMKEIEAGAELVDRSLRACGRLAHGLEDELRLRRRLRRRRGENLADPSKPTPGVLDPSGNERIRSNKTVCWNFRARDRELGTLPEPEAHGYVWNLIPSDTAVAGVIAGESS